MRRRAPPSRRAQPGTLQPDGRALRLARSLGVDLEKGVWHDHEKDEGGGVLDLIARQHGLTNGAALDWLKVDGFDVGEDRQAGRRGMIAAYDYRNEGGELLFQVCRFEPSAIPFPAAIIPTN